MSSSVGMIIPNWMESQKIMFQTTNQIMYAVIRGALVHWNNCWLYGRYITQVLRGVTLWLFYIAMEHGPFIATLNHQKDGSPIKHL